MLSNPRTSVGLRPQAPADPAPRRYRVTLLNTVSGRSRFGWCSASTRGEAALKGELSRDHNEVVVEVLHVNGSFTPGIGHSVRV